MQRIAQSIVRKKYLASNLSDFSPVSDLTLKLVVTSARNTVVNKAPSTTVSAKNLYSKKVKYQPLGTKKLKMTSSVESFTNNKKSGAGKALKSLNRRGGIEIMSVYIQITLMCLD